jgi:hypothetical protein
MRDFHQNWFRLMLPQTSLKLDGKLRIERHSKRQNCGPFKADISAIGTELASIRLVAQKDHSGFSLARTLDEIQTGDLQNALK